MEKSKIIEQIEEKYGEVRSVILLVQKKDNGMALTTYGDLLTAIGMMDIARSEIIDSLGNAAYRISE
jgi:hypothetical protein